MRHDSHGFFKDNAIAVSSGISFLDLDGSGGPWLISTRWVSLCSAHGQSKASLFEKNIKGEKKKIGKARN